MKRFSFAFAVGALSFVLLLLIALVGGLLAHPASAQDDGESWQVFRLDEDAFSFEYPVEWDLDDRGSSLALSNNSGLLEVNGAPFETGDFLLSVYGYSRFSTIGIEEVGSAREALQMIVDGQGSQVAFGTITDESYGDYPAASVRFDNNGRDGTYIMIDVNGQIMTFAGVAPQGELDRHQAEIDHLLTSIHFNPESESEQPRALQEMRLGSPDAGVTILEFGSYGCFACRRIHNEGTGDTIHDLLELFPDDVQFIYINFPVIQPQNDPISAEVGQCVADLGSDAFWLYHETLFALTDGEYARMSEEQDFIDLVGELNLDTNSVSECMEARTHRGAVVYNLNRARRLGVRATPTFMVNGLQVSPANLEDTVIAAVANN